VRVALNRVWFRFELTDVVLRYLNGDGLIPWLNSRLVLGSDGLPVFQSFQPVNFTVMIPWAAMNATSKPIRVIQYGHGCVCMFRKLFCLR
jgi:hypothetical protein